MAELATLARPYAVAAFKVADAEGQLAAWSDALKDLAGIVAHAEVRSVIGDPRLSVAQLATVLCSLVPVGLTAQIEQLVRMLAAARKLVLLPMIAKQFDALKNEREGKIDVMVFSARPVNNEQLDSLAKDLAKKHNSKVNIQWTLDEALIGGIKVMVGDHVLDGSVQGRLDALRASVAI
ncbi:MAG: ATP synthase F1 subcomplex delta subunit [Magnetococcales bacterium]|nr:ATP synthase F1 subcomplex delta subunit [Magnetococcales bacterium]